MPRRMFRYRVYPSNAQTKVLDEELELCRIVYNQLLDHCKQQYKEKGKTPSQFDLNNLLIPLRARGRPGEYLEGEEGSQVAEGGQGRVRR